MDLKLVKLDIDELMNEFVERNSTTFTEFKTVWISRKFSYIFEAAPSTNQGLFMQSLYAHSIGYMVPAGSLLNRLGSLYCLYCLYETQPFNPPYKIYLSIGELGQLTKLVSDANVIGTKVAAAVLKSMLERNMFLFGSVGVNEGSAIDKVNELTDVQNARVQTAYKKLFSNSRLEHFIHMNMGMELDLDVLKRSSSDYAAAKELAIKEASQVIDVENIKHIAENKILLGDLVEKTVGDWESQKKSFYEQTGIRPVAVQEENKNGRQNSCNENVKRKEEDDEDQDGFEKELEEALLFNADEADPTDEEYI